MKTKNTSDYVIAATVVACSVVLLAALTMALTGFSFKKGGALVNIDFPSVAGVRVNSEVRYAGKQIGVVKKISFLKPEQRLKHPENIVRVIAKLDQDAPELYQGTTASIISDTVLAEKFIDIIPANMDDRHPTPLSKLGPQDAILGQKVVGFDDLTRAGYQTIDTVNTIFSDLKCAYPDIHDRIGSLVVHAEGLAKHADELTTLLDELVRTNDPKLKESLKNLVVISRNLKVITTNAKAFSASIGRKPWSLIWGGEMNELPTEEAILSSDQPLPAPAPKENKPTKTKLSSTKHDLQR
ncbi:MAG: MlaD family protein [bacterium]